MTFLTILNSLLSCRTSLGHIDLLIRPTAGETTFFGEIDVPIRFQEDASGNGFTSVGLAVVFGLAF